MKLGNAEIALAMELRTEGVTWKVIARGLSVGTQYLVNRVRRAEREGMIQDKRAAG